LLARLQTQLDESQRLTARLNTEREELAKTRKEMEEQSARREEKRVREWERKREELIADFEARALETITNVASAADDRKSAQQAALQVARAKREFREQAKSVLPEKSPAATAERPPLVEGTRVRLRDIREPATVRRILKNGAVEVEAGFLKMQIAPEDIEEVLSAGEVRKLPKNVTLESGPRWDTSYKELNIIGRTADEAMAELDKFLDSAALASVDRVRIVHGHGMGVLKRAVAELLASNPHVARYFTAPPSEGGSGATIAELRE
jgi:DNA mismatch repair protein MutS2